MNFDLNALTVFNVMKKKKNLKVSKSGAAVNKTDKCLL